MPIGPSNFNLNDIRYTAGNSNIIGNDGNRMGRKTGGMNLDMSDFMMLLAAQLSNQDMLNPVSDTDFIAQMAQFSALEGINTLQQYTLSSYAVSYVGKHVIIYAQDDLTKRYDTVYGQVERITFMGGEPRVVVNGKEYALHTVMEVSHHEIKPPDVEAAERMNNQNNPEAFAAMNSQNNPNAFPAVGEKYDPWLEDAK